jgi:hypothetical protein
VFSIVPRSSRVWSIAGSRLNTRFVEAQTREENDHDTEY